MIYDIWTISDILDILDILDIWVTRQMGRQMCQIGRQIDRQM